MFRLVSASLVVLVLGITVLAQTPATSSDPCAELMTRADRAETRLKDWPQLARYHDDNTKVNPTLEERTARCLYGRLDHRWLGLTEYGRLLSGQALRESRNQRTDDSSNAHSISPRRD